jgi:hypothetical protein
MLPPRTHRPIATILLGTLVAVVVLRLFVAALLLGYIIAAIACVGITIVAIIVICASKLRRAK